MFIKDKNKITNVENISQIYIEEWDLDNTEIMWCIRYVGVVQSGCFSPRFSSSENAEKCLIEIVCAIANNFTIIDLQDICYSIKDKNT